MKEFVGGSPQTGKASAPAGNTDKKRKPRWSAMKGKSKMEQRGGCPCAERGIPEHVVRKAGQRP